MKAYPLRSKIERLLAAEVKAELASRSMTSNDASKILGLSRQSISMKLNGKAPFKATEIYTLSKYLGFDSNEFFRRAEEAQQANTRDGENAA